MQEPRSIGDADRTQLPDDGAIARLARERDPGAWTAIFERHYRFIFSFVRFRLPDAEMAEDVASQTFEVAYRNVERFDYHGVPIEAWLVGIARNLVRDEVKKSTRRGFTAELEEADIPSHTEEVDSVAVRQDLSRAFGHLTDDQQTVLALRFLDDRSVEDTARLMKRSEDAVKNLQRRALGAMHRALAGTVYAEERGS